MTYFDLRLTENSVQSLHCVSVKASSTRPYAQECKGFSPKRFKKHLLSHVNNGLCTERTDPAASMDHSKLFVESVSYARQMNPPICHLPFAKPNREFAFDFRRHPRRM